MLELTEHELMLLISITVSRIERKQRDNISAYNDAALAEKLSDELRRIKSPTQLRG